MANSIDTINVGGVDKEIEDSFARERIENIIAGEAPSAAEIIDARLGADGVTYSSLGTAIRSQIEKLDNSVSCLTLFDILSGKSEEVTTGVRTNGYAWRIGNTPVEGTEYYYVRYDVSDYDVVRVTGKSWGAKYPLVSFYDANNNYVGLAAPDYKEDDYIEEIVKVPEDAEYCYVNGFTYSSNTVTMWNCVDERAYDVIIKSIQDLVTACDSNNVLMDADDAQPNTLYRLYFRDRLQPIVIDNFPIAASRGVMGVLLTLGKETKVTGFRLQFCITEGEGIFYRWASNAGYDDWVALSYRSNSITISPTDDVIGKFIFANNTDEITDVYINAGSYDVMELYKRHYGNDFFNNYTGYSSGDNNMGRGIPLRNGIHYHFSDKALFTASYSGSNENVTTYFSMFSTDYGKGCVVDGLHITACSGLRYAIHSDFWNTDPSGAVEFRNCNIQSNDRCIGAGLIDESTLKLQDCVFVQNGDNVPVHVHTPASGKGKLIVTGCYFNERLQIGGSSTSVNSDALISNCSYKQFVQEPNTPWNVISFNNSTHN